MHINAPKISIIVAVFNGEKTLQQCIDSIVNQSYSNKELIVIDGGSTDGTTNLLKENHKNISYWVSEPDNGIYDAWNKGLKHVSGNWVAFLGADDIFLPGTIQSYVEYLLNHQSDQFDYVSSKVNLVDKGRFIRTIGQPWRWSAFRRYMSVAHVGSLHNKALYELHGVYDTTYKICADYELLLRPRANLKAGFLDLSTVNMSIGGASDSMSSLEEAERAKVVTGGRSVLISRLEKSFALLKLYLRKYFWY